MLYPIGRPKIFLGHDSIFAEIEFDGEKFIQKTSRNEVFGVIKIKLAPPDELIHQFIPFLRCQIINDCKKSYGEKSPCLCEKCYKQRNVKHCLHKNREIEVTLCLNLLAHALRFRKYKILFAFELMVYYDALPIFHEVFSELVSIKDGCSVNVPEEKVKRTLLKQISVGSIGEFV